MELKANHTSAEAIQQIKDKKCALEFFGKISEEPGYTGRILAVGISYDKSVKRHICQGEVLEKQSK